MRNGTPTIITTKLSGNSKMLIHKLLTNSIGQSIPNGISEQNYSATSKITTKEPNQNIKTSHFNSPIKFPKIHNFGDVAVDMNKPGNLLNSDPFH